MPLTRTELVWWLAFLKRGKKFPIARRPTDEYIDAIIKELQNAEDNKTNREADATNV